MIGLDAVTPGSVALLGVPWDENSSFVRGCAAGPAAIRSALFDPESNPGTECTCNLAIEPRLVDAGNVRLRDGHPDESFAAIVDGVTAIRTRGARLLSLGGDHAVSYPLVKAHAATGDAFAIVQIDAHPDLYDDYDDNPYSHASPFARIMENGLASRLVQVGIRAPTPHQRAQAERFGVETIDLREGPPDPARLPPGPVYLSLDLDGLDPAFAPGVAHPEPGGLSTREALRVIHHLPGPLIGADVVELNPSRDVYGATARVAAKLVKEIVARLLSDSTREAAPTSRPR